MDEPTRVCDVEGARDLRDDADRLRRIKAAALEPLPQVAALDVAHRDEEEVVGRPGLVDRDDVRMIDRRGEL